MRPLNTAEQAIRQALLASTAAMPDGPWCDLPNHATQPSWAKELLNASRVSPSALAQAMHQALGYPLWDEPLDAIEDCPLQVWDAAYCLEQRILPWRVVAGQWHFVLADPTQSAVMDRVQWSHEQPVQWWVAAQDRLETALSRWQQRWQWARPETPETDVCPPEAVDEALEDEAVESAPVVQLLQELLRKAHHMGASDLHIEPYEHQVRVRWRIDGHLHEMCQIPLTMRDSLSSRLKVMAQLDIAEKRMPQDGRVRLDLNGQRVHGRVSSLPTLFGEKLVVRLLNHTPVHRRIEDLGMRTSEQDCLLHALSRPQGMILVTGPTGSGKTVTLYACLQQLNHDGVNIATAEDPCEIHVNGINQVQVHEKAGLGFATALRAFLRQDPDVIMIGEIRDTETADMAIKAAQTGHLVLSTLHTNDAPATLTRLLNMGVAAYNIVASIKLVVAQRLVRQLCAHCKAPISWPQERLRAAGCSTERLAQPWHAHEPVGCSRCHQGFSGRMGIYQVLPLTESLQTLILQHGSELSLRQAAEKAGLRSLRDLGLAHVQSGQTSLSEVLLSTPD